MGCNGNETLLVATETKEAKLSRWFVGTIQTTGLSLESSIMQQEGGSVPLLLAEARANSVPHTSWLRQLTYSQPFFKQAFLINQLKSPLWGLWLKYLVKK